MARNRSIHTVILRSWDDLSRMARANWVYRGQDNPARDLRTSLQRCCDRNQINRQRRALVEDELLREFKRAYHQYSASSPLPGAKLEWLALMQHHGAPTRLLDFTYSIYVAAYFAMATAKNDAAIWAVNGPWSARESQVLLKAAGKPLPSIMALVDRFRETTEIQIVDELFFSGSPVGFACPVNPFRLNARLRTQKGIFIPAGDVRRPFMDNLRALRGHSERDNVQRIIIPKKLHSKAIRDLHSMNITHTTLFPGLDGYAYALSVYHPVFDKDGPLWEAATGRAITT